MSLFVSCVVYDCCVLPHRLSYTNCVKWVADSFYTEFYRDKNKKKTLRHSSNFKINFIHVLLMILLKWRWWCAACRMRYRNWKLYHPAAIYDFIALIKLIKVKQSGIQHQVPYFGQNGAPQREWCSRQMPALSFGIFGTVMHAIHNVYYTWILDHESRYLVDNTRCHSIRCVFIPVLLLCCAELHTIHYFKFNFMYEIHHCKWMWPAICNVIIIE